jgi:hypothetical protein
MVGKPTNTKYSGWTKMSISLYTIAVRDPLKCPRCGLGKDTDGDGDCPVCAHWEDGREVGPALAKLIRRSKKKQ